MIDGKWTYRSYRNDPELVGDDPQKALGLIFGEGVFSFTALSERLFEGTLDMGGGYLLDLSGSVLDADQQTPEYAIVGLGRDGTPTAGWRYDYRCVDGYEWPDGVDQVPSLVGTVVRVIAHGPTSPAGVTASFIAVRQP
ncbi:MAG TPA: hypothetical protein VGB70_05000 [Allosphingosinicella sp.]|jgi:hypothetical protein